jgi:hypothetical protein
MTGVPQYASTAAITGSGARGINTAIIAVPDSGTRPVFEDSGGYALPTVPIEGPALLMTPNEQIAPIGSEVILITSYLGSGDRLVTNEKIEWTLEGVGTALKFDGGSICDPLHFDYVRARKITDRYVITKTSQLYQHLDRGTPDTQDDIHLLRGQTWISVNSMREGTTHVTAFAPSLKNWSKRSDVGIIHWVDAQWVLPRLSIAPLGGSRVLTTTVLRQTNGQPRRGWIVRYEILNGPLAGLGSSSAQIEEVETDMSGQASVVLQPRENRTGTNTISVQIIRPAGADGSDRRVTVGSEILRQTWSGNAGVQISVKAPEHVRRGEDIPSTISLTNTTSAIGKGVVVMEVPPLVSFINSDPPPTRTENNSIFWNVEIPPQSTSTIQYVVRAGTEGRLNAPVSFYPQGITPTTSPTTTVPLPPNSPPNQAVNPALPPSSSPFSSGGGSLTPPGPGASTFNHGGQSSSDGASVYSGNRTGNAVLNLTLSLSPNPEFPVRIGGTCHVKLILRNNEKVKINRVTLQLSLPKEYTDRSESGIKKVNANSECFLDRNFNVNLNISELDSYIPDTNPPIPDSALPKEAVLELAVPNTPRQGYSFVGKVLIDGKEVRRISEQILPTN